MDEDILIFHAVFFLAVGVFIGWLCCLIRHRVESADMKEKLRQAKTQANGVCNRISDYYEK